MNPKKILVLISLLGLVSVFIYALSNDFNGCGKGIECYERLFTSGKISTWFVPALAIFLTSSTFLFVKSITNKFFIKYYLVSIPIIIIGILSTNQNPGGWGVATPDREIIAFFLSILFILISWFIALWGYVKGRKKK
jgi:hypothetical protein